MTKNNLVNRSAVAKEPDNAAEVKPDLVVLRKIKAEELDKERDKEKMAGIQRALERARALNNQKLVECLEWVDVLFEAGAPPWSAVVAWSRTLPESQRNAADAMLES
jgi:hypothetical protein